MSRPPAHEVPAQYEIRVKGVLDSRWSAWLEGLLATGKSYPEIAEDSTPRSTLG